MTITNPDHIIIPRTTWITSLKNREGEKILFTFHCDNCFQSIDRPPERYDELVEMTWTHRCEFRPRRKRDE